MVLEEPPRSECNPGETQESQEPGQGPKHPFTFFGSEGTSALKVLLEASWEGTPVVIIS